MELFASTNCLPSKTNLSEKLKLYASVGIFKVDLGAGVTVSEMELDNLYGKKDFEFQIHNYFPPPEESFVLNLASSDDATVKLSHAMATNAVDLLTKLNGNIYSVHPGFVTDPTGFGGISFTFPPPKSPKDRIVAMERFISNLRSLASHAEKQNIQIIVENQVIDRDLNGKILLDTASEFLDLFRSIPSSALGMLLDTGHLNVTSKTLGFDRIEFIELLAPHIRAMHIHDNDGTADYHRPIKPDSWILEVLKHPLLKSVPAVIEAKFESLQDLQRHFFWLEDQLQK